MELVLTSKNDLKALLSESVHGAIQDALQQLQSPGDHAKEWLTNEEAIDYLGLSRPTLQRYRNDGKLPYSRVGSRVYYRRGDIEALLEGHVQAA